MPNCASSLQETTVYVQPVRDNLQMPIARPQLDILAVIADGTVSLLHDGSATPMLTGMGLCGLFALGIYLLACWQQAAEKRRGTLEQTAISAQYSTAHKERISAIRTDASDA